MAVTAEVFWNAFTQARELSGKQPVTVRVEEGDARFKYDITGIEVSEGKFELVATPASE